jgi:RimJ/RimL family protein N-acetyltransferase
VAEPAAGPAATVLVTERLILRQIGPDDLDRHMALLNTPAVMRWLGGVQPHEVIAAKHEASRALFAAEGFGFMMMEERASGELVGHCGMKRLDHPHAPNRGDHEIGWLVREDRWRRGYAYEGMCAVIDWAFTVHAVGHLVAITCNANAGSWRLMEKLGMERRDALSFVNPEDPPEQNPLIQYVLSRAHWDRRQLPPQG